MPSSSKSGNGLAASPRSSTREQGQALVELVIATLMFVPVFIFIYQTARLAYARLELISLTRQAALYMIHEGKSSLPKDVLGELAKRNRLEPSQVSAELGPSLLGSGAGQAPVIGAMAKFLLGTKLSVKYQLNFSGPLGQALPKGLLLSETVTLQADCWKDFGSATLKEMFSF